MPVGGNKFIGSGLKGATFGAMGFFSAYLGTATAATGWHCMFHRSFCE